MRLRPLPALLVLALLAPPLALADYDEGATDAPGTCEQALEVAPGTIRGQSPGGYDADWYKVAVPAGKVAYVTYQVTGDGGWNYVALREATCAYVNSVGPGSTAAMQPAFGYVLLGVSSSWSAFSYALHVALADAPAQDDAGTGLDAPNHWSQAMTVGPGVVRGRSVSSAGDYADWFRVDAAPDEYLVLTSYQRTYFLDVQGRSMGGLGFYPYYTRTYSLVPPGGVLLLGTDEPQYEIVIERLKRTDLAVTDLRADAVPLTTEAGPLPASPQREVSVTLANAGTTASRNARLLVYASPLGSTSPQRILYDRPLAMEAGTQATLTFPWDTLGQVGEVRLHAVVTNAHDLDARNDVATLRTSLLVNGTATGVDLLNHRVIVGASTVGVDHDADRHGADATVFPYYLAGAWAALWLDGDAKVRGTAGVCALYCVSA